MLQPHTPLSFLTATSSNPTPSSESEPAELADALCSGLVSVHLDGEVQLSARSDQETTQRHLVWDAQMLAVLAVVLDIPLEYMKTTSLRTVACAGLS